MCAHERVDACQLCVCVCSCECVREQLQVVFLLIVAIHRVTEIIIKNKIKQLVLHCIKSGLFRLGGK